MGGSNGKPIQQRINDAAAAASSGVASLTSGLQTASTQAQQLHAAGLQLGQSLSPYAKTAYDLAKQYQMTQGAGAGILGGYQGGFFGGDADEAKGDEVARELREYEHSIASKTKEDTIRRIAAAMKRAGIDVDPEGDLEGIIKALVSKIPNPRKGKTFAADAKSQEKVCKTIAEVLNSEFGNTLIDTSLGAVSVCRQVAEWVHSYVSGVGRELMEVHASVKRVLRNIEVLEHVMEELYGNITKRIPDVSKAGVEAEIGNFDEMYKRAQRERKRQEEILKHFLNVTLAPAQKELELALQDESEAHKLIEKIGLKPGTADFADSLAMAISGLGTVASVAQAVHKALKAVGLSVTQYLDSADMQSLNRQLDEKLMSGQVKTEDVGKFLESVQTLRRNFDRRLELKPGFEEVAARTGGADDEKSTVVKRVEKLKTEKKLLMKEFTERTAAIYKEIFAATKALSPKLGKEIPITDKTDSLRDAIERLKDQAIAGGLAKIELALVGFAVNVEAREKRDRFLSALRLVSGTLSSLMELEMYRGAAPLFSRLKAAVDSLEKTINYFSDIITKKYGGQDVDDGEGGEYSGGDPADYMAEISTSVLNLTEALADFIYFYYIAKVRANLAQTSKELASYGEKYVDVLGDAVASRIRSLERERKVVNDYLNDTAAPAGAVAAHHPWTPAGTAPNAEALAGLKAFVKLEYDTKAKFYRVVQAIDLYMKAFTDAIVKEPDAVRDIKKILDGTQVIARWFSEETGENLWKAFECMPAFNNAGNAVVNNSPAANPGDHYYQKVRGGPDGTTPARANANEVGLPQAGVTPGSPAAKNAAGFVNAMFDTFQALKNLINAFSRIGDKFGGRELRTQIFMSPTQIFKALTDYLKASAFSVHMQTTGVQPANALLLPAAPVAAGNPTVNVVPVVPANSFGIYFSSTFNLITGAAAGTTSDFRGNWQVEDRYFHLVLKSMASKVLTVLGVYDMFEREVPLKSLTPTRMIIGGADEADPEVLEDAAELYFRLPRLAEFYRGFLRWDGENDPMRIAMLPELEGIFSGLIRLVFQKLVAPQTGDYSDSELKAMIREINLIYGNYRASGKAVTDALNAFVREINLRYGVIKADDMKAYWNMVNEDRKFTATGQINPTDYAILPGEEDYETDRRAPSDRYALGAPSSASAEFKSKYDIDESDWTDPQTPADHYKRLRAFRARLEHELDVPENQYGKVAYGVYIQQTALEIKRASTKEAKLALVMKLIQGASTARLDSSKAFMFHETVVVGLNVLSAVQSFMLRFASRIEELDFERAGEEIRAGMVALLAGVPAAGWPTPDALSELIGNAYLDMRTGRRVGVRRLMLQAAGTNVRLRGGADPAMTYAAVQQFLQLELTGAAAAATAIPANYPGLLTPAAIGANGAATQAALRFEAALNVALRMVFDYPLAMRIFIENIHDLVGNGQGLVELRYPGTPDLQLQFDFSKLTNFCSSLMSDVKFFMDQLRPFIDASIIRRFEDLSNPGSVFWLEKNLMDKFFRGTGTRPEFQTETVDALSRRANRVFLYMIRDTYAAGAFPSALTGAGYGFDRAGSSHSAIQDGVVGLLRGAGARAFTAANLIGAAGGRLLAMQAPAAGDDQRFETYGRTLSEIIWYDVGLAGNDAAIASVADANDPYPLHDLISTGYPAVPPRALVHVAIGGGPAQRYDLYNANKGLLPVRSLLFVFNQLLAKYLFRLTDQAGGKKIYSNLVNAFANGVVSQSITTPETSAYPDLVTTAGGIAFGWRGDPRANAIVSQSLAYVLQRIIKDANPQNQTPEHLISTLTDVPIYLKEAYRADLPNFIKLFDAIVQKCDFLKQFVQRTTSSSSRLRLNRPSTAALTAIDSANAAAAVGDLIVTGGATYGIGNAAFTTAGVTSLAGLQPLDNGLTDAEMKARVAALTDAISAAAYTLSNAASEVRKELADKPVYLEVQEHSIETYKARYGSLPLMPISLALHYLSDVAAPPGGGTNDSRLMPDHALGEPAFKLAYGVRGLLSGTGPISYEQMPGVKSALEGYNAVATARDRIDGDRYLNFVRRIVAGLRFVLDARNFRSMVSVSSTANDELFSLPNLVGGSQGIVVAGARTAVYSIGSVLAPRTDQEVLSVVESSNQDEQAKLIVDVVGGPTGIPVATNRREELIFNLVDMNIVPINVHALQRDIPLANIFNYSYTFEQMICLFYGMTAEDIGKLTDADTKNTRQMFLRLMLDPYMPITLAMFGDDMRAAGTGGFVHRMFRGDNNLGMGRPKFLSDQVFNKALFGSVYPTQADYDEAGPPAGSAVSRGRDNVGARRAYELALGLAQSLNRDVADVLARLNAAAAVAPLNVAQEYVAVTPRVRSWPGRIRQVAATIGAVRPSAATTAMGVAAIAAADGAVVLFTAVRALGADAAAIAAAVGFAAADAAFIAALTPAAPVALAAATFGQQMHDIVDNAVADSIAHVLATNGAPLGAPILLANPAAPQWAGPSPHQIPANNTRNSALTFFRKPDAGADADSSIVSVNVGVDNKRRLGYVGAYRWNTRVVRNLFFITNIVRLIRLKLNRELSQSRNVIVSSHDAVAAGVTEYGSFNPNETLQNRAYPDDFPGFGNRAEATYDPY